MAGFVDLLEPLDAAARSANGFVWRPRQEEVSYADLAHFGDPMRVVANWSVWTSLAALRAYVYGSEHLAAMRDRRAWFRPASQASLALWWLPAGHRPTASEAHQRITMLRRHGPTPSAFTFDHLYQPPSDPPATLCRQSPLPVTTGAQAQSAISARRR